MNPHKFFAHFLTFGALSISSAYALEPIPLFASRAIALHQMPPGDIDLDRPFDAPLPALVKDAQGKRLMQLTSCRDYLAVRGRIIGSDNDANYRVLRSQAAPCVAITLYKSASEATKTSLPADFLKLVSTSSYPATLWPAVSDDERQKLIRKCATLRTASGKPSLRVVNGEVLELEAAGIGLHLTLLARGDFDHDGWEDAAFLWEAYALKGSYTDARLVVLTRTGKTVPLHELLFDKLLGSQ